MTNNGFTFRLTSLRSLFILIVIVSINVSASSPLSAQSSDASAYQETPCPFDTSTLVMNVHCGLMTVPENRLDASSRTIVLMVMIAESPNPDKAPDPIVFLSGGPGESAIANFVPLLSSEQGAELLRERDWIVVDQRGTGFSVPRLDCNIFGINRAASSTALIEASQICHQRYAASGIDLRGYTTQENAADFAELREAMGYEAWNLFGVSYGTTLALTLMRDYPQGIRSVVLDSTLPPQYSFFVSDVEQKRNALQRVFDACAAEAACDEAYPDLANRFETAVESLNAAPLELDGITLNGDFLVFALTNTSVFQRELIQQLPSILDRAFSGEFEDLVQLLEGVVTGTDTSGGYESDLVAANDGMGLAVNCTWDARFPGVRTQLLDLLEEDATASALARLYLNYLDTCEGWNSGLAELVVPKPVQSDIPVLFLVGEWDPSTPLSMAEEGAETLSNAQIVVFQGQGHSILLAAEDSCPAGLLNVFIEEPLSPTDVTCVDTLYRPISFSD